MSPQLISLLILVFSIVFFLTEWIPSTVTSMIACLAFALTGVCTFSQAFSGFSNSTVILVFGMMVIGDSMFATGVSHIIGRKVLQIAANNERRFIFIAGLTSAIMSAFLANTAVIAMFLAIMNSITRSNKDISLKNICLATSMGAMFGGTCTLVGSTPQLTTQSILETTAGQSLHMWDFLPVGICLTVLYLAYVLFIGYPLGKKIWGNRSDDADQAKLDKYSASADEEHAKGQDKRKQISMIIILLLMIFLFTTELISNVMTACICALLCLLTGCITEKQVFRGMDWPVLFRLAGCLGIGVGIDKSGCGTLIADAFISVFGADMSPVIFLAGAVLLTMVTSNFITNSTAVFVVLPPVLAICQELGLNCTTFALAICYGANLCFVTPLANAQTGMTMVAGYKFKDYFKYNILLEIIVFIGIVALTPVFFSLYA